MGERGAVADVRRAVRRRAALGFLKEVAAAAADGTMNGSPDRLQELPIEIAIGF